MYGVEMLNVGNNVFSSTDSSAEQTSQFMQNISNSLLIHGVSYLFFPVFFLWAILVRQKDSETHKRLMILATLVLMIPGLGRLLSLTQVLPDLGLNIVDAGISIC
jgi:ABC-type Fe3+ transport system permease subunit